MEKNEKEFIQKKRNREINEQKENNNKEIIENSFPLNIQNFPKFSEEINYIKNNTEFFLQFKEKIPIEKFHKNYFGNYKSFYYNRYLDLFKNDKENFIFDENFFKDKVILDIGCNIGTLTILIANYYNPKFIQGIDIDSSLIKEALNQCKKTSKIKYFSMIYSEAIKINDKKIENNNNNNNDMEIEKKIEINNETLELVSELEQFPLSLRLNLKYKYNNEENFINIKSNNIFFKCCNYISKLYENEKYDTILCLKITKWIHLNYGDFGIKVLFYNIYKQLKKNGILIIECDSFNKYKKEKKFKDKIKEIKFFPKDFVCYLENVYDFKFVKTLLLSSNSKKNYIRPIHILKK